MRGAFSQFERKMGRKRHTEGITKPKAPGVYSQRKLSVNTDRVKQLLQEGMTKAEVAKEMNISRQSVYRCLVA